MNRPVSARDLQEMLLFSSKIPSKNRSKMDLNLNLYDFNIPNMDSNAFSSSNPMFSAPESMNSDENLNTGNLEIPMMHHVQEQSCDNNLTLWDRKRREFNFPSKPGWKYHGLKQNKNKDGLSFNQPIPCYIRGERHSSYKSQNWVSDF